jgi:hypothetical protein
MAHKSDLLASLLPSKPIHHVKEKKEINADRQNRNGKLQRNFLRCHKRFHFCFHREKGIKAKQWKILYHISVNESGTKLLLIVKH